MRVRHPVTGVLDFPRVTLFAASYASGKRGYPTGVLGPDHKDGGSDWRIKPGKKGNERKGGARPCGIATYLLDALAQEHDSEMYMVPYEITCGWQPLTGGSPRVNKSDPSGFDWLASQGHESTWSTVTIDIDNPKVPGSTTAKLQNTEASVAQWAEQLRRPELDGFGWLVTSGGVHLKKLLATASVSGEEYEGIVRTARAQIDALDWESFGQPVKSDKACVDMSRLMSLPYIAKGKDQRPFRSPIVDLSRMRASDLEPTYERSSPRQRRVSARARPASQPYSFAEEIPDYVEQMISHINDSTLRDMAAGASRHVIMMAVAGAILVRGFEPELIPVAVRSISMKMGLDRTHVADDFRSAQETIEKWQRGVDKLTGMATLKQLAPTLARAIDVLASTQQVRAAAESRVVSQLPTAAEARDTIEAVVRAEFSRSGAAPVPYIGGTCGLGKSRIALKMIAENARGVFPGWVKGKHAGLTARSLLSAPTQEVAVELQRALLETRGYPSARWTSGLSERYVANDTGPEGTFVCKYHDSLTLMAEGGLSSTRHGCNGGGSTACPEVERGCRAALGAVDNDGNPLDPTETGFADRWPQQIATHARSLHALDNLGTHAKWVLDETPELMKSTRVTEADLDITIKELAASAAGERGLFDIEYARAMLPAMHAVRAWLRDGDAKVYETQPNLATAMMYSLPVEVVDDAPHPDPVESARMAPFQKAKTGRVIQRGPPFVKPAWLRFLRENKDAAALFAKTGRFCFLVWRCLQEDSRTSARLVIDLDKDRSILVIEPSEIIQAMAERQAPRVIFCADAELRAAEVSPHLFGNVVVTPVHAADAASVTVSRRQVMHPAAARSKATERGRFVPGGRHLELVRVAAEWMAEAVRPERVVIVTWKTLAVALRFAQADNDNARDALLTEWLAAKQRKNHLVDIAAELVTVMPTLPAVAVLHYGATRGVDAYRDHDAIALLGEPRPNIDAMNAEVAHLTAVAGLSQEQAESLRETVPQNRARSEAGQGVGRLRTPNRTTDARMLNVGDILPAEWEHHSYEIREGNSILAQIGNGSKGAEYGRFGKSFGHLGAASGILGGRPKNDNAMDAAEFEAAWKALTLPVLVSVSKKSESTLWRFRRGTVGIPADVANDVRRAVAGLGA